MDRSASAGIIGAAFAIGRSFQPNLLTRGSTDQAIITGTSSGIAYQIFSAADSLLAATASRLGRTDEPSATSRLVVAGASAAAGLGAEYALRWREHEPDIRAIGRLVAHGMVVTAGASAFATATNRNFNAGPGRKQILAAVVVGAAAWASTQPWKSLPGSATYGNVEGATEVGGKYFFEDQAREVTPVKAAGIGVGVAAATLGLSYAESALTNALAHGASIVLGGQPQDHRALGRMTSLGIFAGAGWFAVSQVDTLLSKGGGGIEPGLMTPPEAPEITGSPASGLPWNKQTREGARWLSMALRPETINSVMQIDNAIQPIRVYGSLEIASSDEQRAQVLLDEIDRTRALERPYVVLWSPTGSGYVNYVACETFEYLTRGNCASVCIQYSVLPSSLSLTDVKLGTDQTRMVFAGISQRLAAMPPEKRPRVFLFGESLGSQVSEEMFEGMGVFGPESLGLDAGLWIGTPDATKWRQQIWGDRSVSDVPGVGPGDMYLPRWVGDWTGLPADQRARVRYLLLQNGDDPIPKFWFEPLYRRPAWLGPWGKRPPGSPKHTIWWPVTTFFATFIDMLNALAPTPGVFVEGGHDYRLELPDAVREVWRLECSDEQMASIQQALRRRELSWETKRRWMEAEAVVGPEARAEKERKVLDDVATWTGRSSVTPAEVQQIIDTDCQPT